jgi:YggT family protein
MPFLELISLLLRLYTWVIIIGVVMNWLVMFNVINARNELVQSIGRFCHSATEPALRRIRRHVKPINGMDLSPLILLLAIHLLNRCLGWYVAPFLMQRGL